MERLARRRDDRRTAPGAVAPAVAAEMLAVRSAPEIAQVEVRIAAMRAVDAAHVAAELKAADELKGRWRSDIDASDFAIAEESRLITVKQRDRMVVAIDAFQAAGLLPHMHMNARRTRLNLDGR